MQIPNYVHRLLISILFSVVNWKLIDLILIDIQIWKYFIIEFTILVLVRLLVFTYRQLDIEDNEEEEEE